MWLHFKIFFLRDDKVGLFFFSPPPAVSKMSTQQITRQTHVSDYDHSSVRALQVKHFFEVKKLTLLKEISSAENYYVKANNIYRNFLYRQYYRLFSV